MIYLLPLLTVFIWGTNAVASKMAASLIEPSAMSFYRWLFAIAILTPFCLPKVIKLWSDIRPNLAKLTVLGLLGMVINQSCGYFAAVTTTASNMSLISALVPLIAIFISVPILGKPISRNSIMGGVIALVGLAYMLGKGDMLFFLSQSVTTGDALMVVASFAYALYCVLLKRWKMNLPNTVSIYVQGFASMIMLAPIWLTSDQLLPPSEAMPIVLYASIAASIAAPWMWIKSIDVIGADNSAMFMNLLPVVAVTLAATTLGETVHIYHLIGGIMVISGVILAQIKRRKKDDIEPTILNNDPV
ncbi:DMT family transporter [Vibrio renipiscarius]|uniref:Multidrug DMT transporter n=1 Tax=Vibrio renipiscarius TaxID=1461322 RepID=A0A0C2NUN7_9VIBR|nr:DMT family transporter [Vibrio renipiscarius]KII76597.1 multidrug DMT transporter [Vibrio renipiscarius]KII77882.1 multidrug DMT transporter [Vibrio renipiscarius]